MGYNPMSLLQKVEIFGSALNETEKYGQDFYRALWMRSKNAEVGHPSEHTHIPRIGWRNGRHIFGLWPSCPWWAMY